MSDEQRLAELTAEVAALREEISGKPPALRFEDIKRMSPEEINERWDEVAPVLEAGPGAGGEGGDDEPAD